MKKLLIFCLVFSCYFCAQAQKDDTPYNKRPNKTETLFNKAKVIGGFAGPIFEYSELGGDLEVTTGGGGGLIVNNFFLGGYGMRAINGNYFENEELERIRMKHGGFWLGYALKPHKLLHLFTSAKIGFGDIEIDMENGSGFNDAIFVATPEIGLELNIFRFFKIAFTGGYRIVDGYDRPFEDFSQDELNGLVGGITLRIGGFGHHIR